MSDMKPGSLPSHVSAHNIFEFDLMADAPLRSDPTGRLNEVRENYGGLFWTPLNGGHWVVTSYKLVSSILNNPVVFSSGFSEEELQLLQSSASHTGRRSSELLVLLDGPLHAKLRTPLQRALTPKMLSIFLPEIEDIAEKAVLAASRLDKCEIMTSVASPIALKTLFMILGIPIERISELNELVKAVFENNDRSFIVKRPAAFDELAAAIRDDVIAERYSVGNGLICRLWNLQIDGEEIPFDVIIDFVIVILIPGVNSMKDIIGFAVRHLAKSPDLQEELRAHRDRIPRAVEEILRLNALGVLWRRVREDIELEGVRLEKGDSVRLFLLAANLDPRVFPSDNCFTMGRRNEAHISFGAGPHLCVGSGLARLELVAVINAILTGFPTFRLAEDQPCRLRIGHNLGVDSLTLSWAT